MITPLLIAAGTAVAVLLIDLFIPRWRAPYLVALLGAGVTAFSAIVARPSSFGTSLLCASVTDPSRSDAIIPEDCSYVFDSAAQLITVVIALLTVAAILLFAPLLRSPSDSGDAAAGESMFLLTAAMTGGVALAGAGDLITLIVALETLTLPLYALVALHRRRAGEAAEAAVTFFITSVVATATALLGASLIYLASGAIYLRGGVNTEFLAGSDSPELIAVGLVLLLAGLGFKVAAVPLHAWAPKTYDGAPLPVAAYLSTASKLGGVVAILIVTHAALKGDLQGAESGVNVPLLAGGVLGILAVASMVVGTLGALRQQRTVRLLAWSSVAQAGFILAPLAGLVGVTALGPAARLLDASLVYTLFFLVLEIGAFSAVVALRADRPGGGTLAELAGLGRSAPLRSLGLVVALIGLAGLPPTLAGLFAKVTVVRALLDVDAAAIAVLVALISVVGLAVYWRPAAALYRSVDDSAADSLGTSPTPAPEPVGGPSADLPGHSVAADDTPSAATPGAAMSGAAMSGGGTSGAGTSGGDTLIAEREAAAGEGAADQGAAGRLAVGPIIALVGATVLAIAFSLFPQLVFDLVAAYHR